MGESAAKAVLTKAQVVSVVKAYQAKAASVVELADSLGVHKSTIKRILDGSNWQHVTAELGIVPKTRGKYPLFA